MSDQFVPDGGFGLSTATFNVLDPANGGQRSRKGSALMSIEELPFGGGVVIQSGGIGAKYRSYRIYVSSEAELENLEAARGYHGKLITYIDNAPSPGVGATLMDFDASTWYLADSGGGTLTNEVMVNFVMDS